MVGELLFIPDLIINTDTPILSHRSSELYAAIVGRFEGRVNDDLSDVVNLEHVVAGVVRQLLFLFVHRLLICGSSYKVELASKGDASRDNGSSLVIQVEELNDSLV